MQQSAARALLSSLRMSVLDQVLPTPRLLEIDEVPGGLALADEGSP